MSNHNGFERLHNDGVSASIPLAVLIILLIFGTLLFAGVKNNRYHQQSGELLNEIQNVQSQISELNRMLRNSQAELERYKSSQYIIGAARKLGLRQAGPGQTQGGTFADGLKKNRDGNGHSYYLNENALN